MSDGMRRELVYLSSYATNRYFIPNWGTYSTSKDLKKDFLVIENVPEIIKDLEELPC